MKLELSGMFHEKKNSRDHVIWEIVDVLDYNIYFSDPFH